MNQRRLEVGDKEGWALQFRMGGGRGEIQDEGREIYASLPSS
jgi:hypothetical protein